MPYLQSYTLPLCYIQHRSTSDFRSRTRRFIEYVVSPDLEATASHLGFRKTMSRLEATNSRLNI